MVMQVKKATFQRMGSGGKGRTENRWDVRCRTVFTIGSISYTSTVSTSRSRRLTVGATTFVRGDTAVMFCKQDQYLMSLYTSPLYVVGPCHHGMARPQVADRGTASDKEGSCE